jgi:hypothetical protein
MKHPYRLLLLSVLLLAGTHLREACAQDQPAVTTSAAAFLRVAPDARGAGMGDAGAATPGDANAAYWNPAKLVFVPGGKGVSLSYAPWLRQAAANMWISQVSGFFMPGRNQAVGASLVYFNEGTVSLRDMNRQRTGDFNPREFALTGTYALKLSEYASLAASLKYVYSNLVGSSATGLDGSPAHAVAGDVGAYLQTDPGELHRVNVAFGTILSNLGTRVSYGTPERYFLPTNLRVGTGVTYRFGEEGRLTFALDANKLMLPSRPVYDFSNVGPPVIVRGRNPDRDYFSSVFGSFTDSPDRLAGELKEFNLAGGVELWPNQYLALRGGYFYESARDGDRRYFTGGVGIRYNGLGLDASYLVPQWQNHPLAQTVRLTLTLSPVLGESRNALVYSNSRNAGRSYGGFGGGTRRPNVARAGHRRHQLSIYRKNQAGSYTKGLRKKQTQRERRTRQNVRKTRFRR